MSENTVLGRVFSPIGQLVSAPFKGAAEASIEAVGGPLISALNGSDMGAGGIPELSPPTPDLPAVEEAGKKEREKGRGRLSNILTSGRGLAEQPYSMARRTLLGS